MGVSIRGGQSELGGTYLRPPWSIRRGRPPWGTPPTLPLFSSWLLGPIYAAFVVLVGLADVTWRAFVEPGDVAVRVEFVVVVGDVAGIGSRGLILGVAGAR